MHKNLNICRSNIIYLACLDFTLFYRFGDRVDEAASSLAEWYLADNKCLVVELVYLGSDRKSTRLNSSHLWLSRMPSSA